MSNSTESVRDLGQAGKARGTAVIETLSGLSKDVTIFCYEGAVPAFVEAEMDLLYRHVNSSLSHYAVKRKAGPASTYVARRAGQALAILLFTRTRNRVKVINEMIDIAQHELDRFANFIFATYPDISIISFSLIGNQGGKLGFPTHQHDMSEDIVLTLPATPEAYIESLSHKTRRNIRRYLRTIAREHPGFHFEVFAGAEITDQHILDIIALKKQNIGQKNIKFGMSADDLEWILRQAKVSGLVTIAVIDGRVCGGTVSMQVADHYFGQIMAYDPAYAKHSLGILCCYQDICNQILRGAAESHLCWGRYQYKYKLNGALRERSSLDIYRSRLAYGLNAGEIVKKSLTTGWQEFRKRLRDMELEEGAEDHLGPRVIRALRRIKRFRWRDAMHAPADTGADADRPGREQ